MMRKSITRTFSTSTINAYVLEIVDGNPVAKQLEPITIMGKAKEKDALKVLKEKYGKLTAITISEIKVEECAYEISVDDFIKYANKIETETAETTN